MTHVLRKTKSAKKRHARFVHCKIYAVNKQLVSPLSWNNPLSKASIGESYILMIYKYLDAKEKHYLDVEGVYNM